MVVTPRYFSGRSVALQFALSLVVPPWLQSLAESVGSKLRMIFLLITPVPVGPGGSPSCGDLEGLTPAEQHDMVSAPSRTGLPFGCKQNFKFNFDRPGGPPPLSIEVPRQFIARNVIS